jgi:hypothetical protein
MQRYFCLMSGSLAFPQENSSGCDNHKTHHQSNQSPKSRQVHIKSLIQTYGSAKTPPIWILFHHACSFLASSLLPPLSPHLFAMWAEWQRRHQEGLLSRGYPRRPVGQIWRVSRALHGECPYFYKIFKKGVDTVRRNKVC